MLILRNTPPYDTFCTESRGKDDRRRSVQENLSDWDSDDSNVENETMDGEDNLAFIEEIQIQPMPDLRSYCGQHEMDDRETSFTVSPATVCPSHVPTAIPVPTKH